jgi:hypothetical protein
MNRAERLAQQRIGEDARTPGLEEPPLVAKEGCAEHVTR